MTMAIFKFLFSALGNINVLRIFKIFEGFLVFINIKNNFQE